MSAGVVVSSCLACGWQGLPERLWCPSCQSDRVATVAVSRGTLEERTSAHRVANVHDGPVRIGSVRIEGGATLIARIEGGAAPGTLVELSDDHGAAVARASET
jgi:uncharacterized OB-fold protein